MNILSWFKTSTNYPKSQLTDKQKQIINMFDEYCVQNNKNKMGDHLSILSFKVGIRDQFHTPDYIMKKFTQNMKLDGYYIPRTIAFIVDPDGTWVFYIGIRNNLSSSTVNERELFIDALTRTNSARTE